MKSMTGFAQGRFEFENISVNIIVKSLNHRFLDITLKGTGITPVTDRLIRDLIKEKIFRGKLEITFDLFEMDPKNWDIQFNDYLLEEILNKVLRFKKKYKENINLSLESFLKIPTIFYLDQRFDEYSDEKKRFISESVITVLNQFIDSRIDEGKYIYTTLAESIQVIKENLASIDKETDSVEGELFSKYKEKIARFMDGIEMDERRIVQEAAIAADKSCISEEIQRLTTHCRRLEQLLDNNKITIKGKEADFLAQEMQRETHTIGAKTPSMDIHHQVLKIRREIEKIKQQVQNIE